MNHVRIITANTGKVTVHFESLSPMCGASVWSGSSQCADLWIEVDVSLSFIRVPFWLPSAFIFKGPWQLIRNHLKALTKSFFPPREYTVSRTKALLKGLFSYSNVTCVDVSVNSGWLIYFTSLVWRENILQVSFTREGREYISYSQTACNPSFLIVSTPRLAGLGKMKKRISWISWCFLTLLCSLQVLLKPSRPDLLDVDLWLVGMWMEQNYSSC